MTATQSIQQISELFDEWRTLGSRRLGSGVELIGHAQVDDDDGWLHAVFPPLGVATIARIEKALGSPLPPSLRTFYRCVGGLSVFAGLFEVCGHRISGWRTGDLALQPRCIVALNHELDALPWKPRGAVAFATNQWDLSVYLLGMGSAAGEVARCERSTGRVMETHRDVLDCIAQRLSRLDQMVVK